MNTKPMAIRNSDIHCKRKERVTNVLATIGVIVVVFFISAVDSIVDLVLKAFGL